MNHKTNIDTVAIQLDFKTAKEQRDKFDLIYSWIFGKRIGALHENIFKSNHTVRVYELISGRNKLATLHTSFSKNFYIRIKWCGLKSYKEKHDKASFNSLMTICALLNTSRTEYRFVELDIALDLFCPFNKVLATCIKPVNNITYNHIGFLQYFNYIPTSYIEDYTDKNKKNNAMKRSYLYNKSNKEGLNSNVTRFEIKLQNRYFLRYGFTFDSISKALSKYAIFYFDRFNDKQFELEKLSNKTALNYLELNTLENKYYKVPYSLKSIENFIHAIKSVYVDFYGSIVFPKMTKKF